MNELEHYLIDVVRAAVTGTKPPTCSDWKKLIDLARFNDLQNLVAEAAPQADYFPGEIAESLRNVQITTLLKDANQEAEVYEVIRLFEKSGIKAVLLKGWYLKRLYPRMDLRTMADTDIFIRQSDELRVHEILKNRGYECYSIGNKKDNAYTKAPFMTLEIHKNLFFYEDDWNLKFNSSYSNMYIWKRLVKLDGYEHIYRMDDELFFVYMIAHTAKHLIDDGGIGVKAFLDIWIYRRCKPELNYDIIFRDFESLNLLTFAKKAISLSEYWFDKKPVSPEIEAFGDYILKCGVYGNSSFFVINNEVMRDGKSRGNWSYAFKRAFPNMESMKVRYPQLEKKPWLLPVCYTKRLWYSITHRKDAIKGEINSAGNIDYEQARQIRDLYKKIGLSQIGEKNE